MTLNLFGLSWYLSEKGILFSLLLAFALCDTSYALFRKNLFPSHIDANRNVLNPGTPLFLTPYINSGRINEARKLSEVTSLPNAPNIKSYAGFFTVNTTYNSNMFFWFFPALNNDKYAPVLLWLQGGPGGSSLFGLFLENGPFVVKKDLKLAMREYTWTKQFSVVYIDNPVGTGFSFTDSENGYAEDENDVANDLYEALQQFFTIYHEYRANDFYITGESYAGKYVPAISYKIFTEGSKCDFNLKGMSIGDGYCDPETMLDYGDYLYQIGLLDENQRDFFLAEQKKALKFIKQGKYVDAFNIMDMLIDGEITNSTSYFTNVTGLEFYYNFLYTIAPNDFNYYPKYLGLDDTRRAIHVGNQTYSDGDVVATHLINDIMQSVKPWVEVLLDNHYKLLIYSGQLDVLVAAPLTENFLWSVHWRGSAQYKTANRLIWKVSSNDTDIAGYVRKVRNLYQIIVRNGGHILPYDQPRAALDMITRFVTNKSFQ